MKSIKKKDAVWLAAATLAMEKYEQLDNPTEEDMYFGQPEIVKRAESIIGDTIPNALVSSHCNASSVDSNYNYLVSGKGDKEKFRRLSFLSEFNGKKERPQLDKEIVIKTPNGNRTVGEIFDFVDGRYTKLVSEAFSIDEVNRSSEIDCKYILEHVLTYGERLYKGPDKVQSEVEKEEMFQLSERGKKAVRELDKIAEICEKEFGIVKYGQSTWLAGNRQQIRNYLWRQLKKPGYEKCPTSISLFAEKYTDSSARFRFSVEIDVKSCDDIDFENHAQILEKDLVDNLFYIVGSKTEEPVNDSSIVKQAIEKNKKIHLQISTVITMDDINNNDLSNEDIIAEMTSRIKKLVPYYELVLEAYNSNKGVEGGTVSVNSTSNNRNEEIIKDKNIILYGPPGTGKTYNTVNYAVAIIENKNFEEIAKEDYKEVFERYKFYKERGQIEFITFHQSYGYEEFIEGIKPDLENEENELTYKIEPGVFKKFCSKAERAILKSGNAQLPSVGYSFNENPQIWKVSLDGSGQNKIKEDCFNNDRIRIGWDKLGKEWEGKINTISYTDQETMDFFYNQMNIGDIVLSLGDIRHVDAIGIIEGEAEWLEDVEEKRRSRKVKWLVKNIWVDIYELNGKKSFAIQTIQKIKRFTVKDVIKLINKNIDTEQVNQDNTTRNYVFVIDEINRGNISKIFGELITLIESTKRIGADEELKVTLPYSKEPFGVPENVYILGTMNTADRSIALLDTALRRRFTFIEKMPEPELLKSVVIDDKEIDINKMLKTLNERIELLYDREHTIGHAFFMKLKEESSIADLANIFEKNIIPLLQEYFFEDYGKIQLVLGDNAKEDNEKFILDKKVGAGVFKESKESKEIDLPEIKYSIQKDAFQNIESYIKIYE